MKKLFLNFLFVILTNSLMFSQVKVKVVLITNNNQGEKLYISGNQPELGSWNPDNILLEKENDSTWSKQFIFKSGERIEFKFTKGSWLTEALDNNGNVPDNISFLANRDTVVKISVRKWKNANKKVKGGITGQVKYHRNFICEGLLPRDVIVWLPPGYDSLTIKRYPVMYLQDAQNIIDPNTSLFGNEWQVDETADSLIKSGAIKEIIIVGIYNTRFRNFEYGDTDSGKVYLDFMINSLKPFIDSNYRTLSDRENTAIGGSSLGALIAFKMGWEHPEYFSKVACLSPAFEIDKIDYVSKVTGYLGAKPDLKFYFDVGEADLELELKRGTINMINALEQKGFSIDKDIYFYHDYSGLHDEKSWSKRVWRFLEFFFSKDQSNY